MIAGIAAFMAGCANGRVAEKPEKPGGGTAGLTEESPVQGRDLGRGGATSGGISSLDPTGNAADRSIYYATHQGP